MGTVLLIATGSGAIAPPAGAEAVSLAAGASAHRYGGVMDDVDAVSATDGWAVGGPGRRGSLIEHWDGSSWTKADNP